MAYDDDPYWPQPVNGDKNVIKLKPKTEVKRFIPDASDVLAEAEKTHRAPLPSPLLIEWMKRNQNE